MSAPRESGKIIGAIGRTSYEAVRAAGPNDHGQVVVGEVDPGRYLALVPQESNMDRVKEIAARIIKRHRNAASWNSNGDSNI